MIRIKEIDFLKTIGILGVIIAHVNPPEFIFQLRNFDVVLLIAISAFLFLSSGKKVRYGEYIFKRIKRLLIPTYLFLALFFLLISVFNLKHYSGNQILNSFLLRRNSIGYVWIVQLYLIEAAILPPLKEIFIKRKNAIILLAAFIFIGLQEVLFQVNFFNKAGFIGETLSYILPCASVSLLALFYKKSSKSIRYLPSAIFLIIFAIITIAIIMKTGIFYNTNIAKYPMRTYYLSYALGLTGIIVYLTKTKPLKYLLTNKIICFIGSNSFWVYLWHIFYLTIFSKLFPESYWLILYTLVLVASIITVKVQIVIVERFLKNSPFNKYLIG